jgi:precorrin-6A/cobalt-precorrin-6A reductase
MILVLGGTTEGRELANLLQQKGYDCLLSVAGELGEVMAAPFPGEVHRGPLDRDGLKRLIREHNITAVIDATHPHAVLITEYAQDAAVETGTPYVRFERPPARLPEHPDLHQATEYPQAFEFLQRGQGGILFTIGIRGLHHFQSLWQGGRRPVWVKVYPELASIQTCLDLGLKSQAIFAFHGPGSLPLFTALLEETGAQWLVVKESGAIGGTELKVQAALELGRKVLVIARPVTSGIAAFQSLEEILEWVEAVQSSKLEG